ncbi:coil containing protein [Vibrio phage 1.243.O._10N.261.54.B5]|nr:coil containing protein [Vibrio phage 1.243.O._10N.261.54.B5]
MSDLDNAINSINASAAKAENTATFLDDMSTFDDQSSVTNPNNGQTVASIPKQVKDRTDELFTAAESDINQAVADAEQSATDAQDAADSIGRYQGLWPDSGGSADKGDTYQTQVSGTPTGQYFTALQNTTVDPVSDDVNWREVVSGSSIGLQEVTATDSTTPRTLEERFTDILNVRDNGGGENPSNSGWEDSPALVKSKNTSNNTLTDDEVNFGSKSLKVWKKASGIKDSAVAASFSLGDETEPKTQVTGVNAPSELANYSNRDCVAVFAQNLSRPARFTTSDTTFTATSVIIPSLPDDLYEGMLIDVNQGGSPWYTARIESVSGNTITVLAWYEVGTANQGTPSDGEEIKVDSFTKIWAHNANIEIKTDGEANSGTGFELGLLCQKTGSGASTGGFDVAVLDGEEPLYGFRARGTAGHTLKNGFLASDNARISYASENAEIGQLIDNPTQSAVLVRKNGNARFRVDEQGRQSGTYYPIQLASTSSTIGINSVYTVATATGITITLPSAASVGSGKVMYIVNKSGGDITVSESAINILSDGLTRKLISDGNSWIRITGE